MAYPHPIGSLTQALRFNAVLMLRRHVWQPLGTPQYAKQFNLRRSSSMTSSIDSKTGAPQYAKQFNRRSTSSSMTRSIDSKQKPTCSLSAVAEPEINKLNEKMATSAWHHPDVIDPKQKNIRAALVL
eukprot:12398234-Karenia_brevis.AAC.1